LYADRHEEVLKQIETKQEIDEEVAGGIKQLLDDYKATVSYLS